MTTAASPITGQMNSRTFFIKTAALPRYPFCAHNPLILQEGEPPIRSDI
jgi:hypothetical protein